MPRPSFEEFGAEMYRDLPLPPPAPQAQRLRREFLLWLIGTILVLTAVLVAVILLS